MLSVVALGSESHCVPWKAETPRAPLAVALLLPAHRLHCATQLSCSSCPTQQDLLGWGKCSITLLAATSQAANEELWPRFVPCRTFSWLIPQPEPHWSPPANTNPIQIPKQRQQNLSHPSQEAERPRQPTAAVHTTADVGGTPRAPVRQQKKSRQNQLENRYLQG